MRIKVKWTSCGHRKKMAVLVLYVYADGKRQPVGYYCADCLDLAPPFDLETWAHLSTVKVHGYLALYPEQVGDVTILFARIAGAEEALPDARLDALVARLEAQKVATAAESVAIFARSGMAASSAEDIARGIAFAAERGASPEDYTRR